MQLHATTKLHAMHNFSVDAVLHRAQSGGMTHLAEYIAANGIKRREFADTIGVHQSVLSRFLRNLATPSLETAVAIQRATNGAVPVETWVQAKEGGNA